MRDVYLPQGTWYGFFENKFQGSQTIISTEEKMPVYVKPATMIALKQDKRLIIQMYGNRGKQDFICTNRRAEIERDDKKVTIKRGIDQETALVFMA